MKTDPEVIVDSPTQDYYTALHRATLAISSSLELDAVLQSIVESVTTAMRVKGAVLRLLDPARTNLSIGAVYGLSADYQHKGAVEVIDSPIYSEVLCCHPVYVSDVRTDPRFKYKDSADREGLVSALSVPLEVRGEAIGVMRVYTGEVRIFSDQDVQFLSVLASLAALSIENARLYENVKNSYSGVISAFWGASQPLS